jgi:hypothetical protein
VIDVNQLEPRRHDPPPGWSGETFERVTDALADVLLAALRRLDECEPEGGDRVRVTK